jgi:hypothetical protein
LIRLRLRPRTAFVAAVLALSFGACGVPTEDHPQIVERKDVPFGLVQDDPPRASPPQGSSPTR